MYLVQELFYFINDLFVHCFLCFANITIKTTNCLKIKKKKNNNNRNNENKIQTRVLL